MKFTLVYEGELKSNDRPARKWEIRKQFHPQLQELWRVNPALQHVMRNRKVPVRDGFTFFDRHHSLDQLPDMAETSDPNAIDLCASIEVGGRKFLPLVRESFALNCTLKIIFLRKEEPGRVYQGGDIDNRLKTLFDALSMPNRDQIVEDHEAVDPIYCLLEDDSRITGLNIETHRLLSRPGVSEHHVHLIIEADVRVAQSRIYNQAFLGD